MGSMPHVGHDGTVSIRGCRLHAAAQGAIAALGLAKGLTTDEVVRFLLVTHPVVAQAVEKKFAERGQTFRD